MAENKELTLHDNDDGSVVIEGLDGNDGEAHYAEGGKIDDKKIDPDPDNDEFDDELAGAESEATQRNAGEEQEEAPRKGEEHLSKTERNRLERVRKREARDRKFTELRQQIAEKDARLAILERNQNVIMQRQHGSEVAQVSSELDKASKSFNYYDAQYDLAKTANNTAAMIEAAEGRAVAKARYEEVDRVKQQIEAGARNPARNQADPTVVANGARWAAKHPWMRPGASGDDKVDAKIVMLLDAAVTEEGYDPKTEAYWQELDRRVKKSLPHRVNSDNNGDTGAEGGASQNNSGRRPGPTGQGREGNRKTGSGGFILSKGRKEAMMASGAWDDPAQRARVLKAYRDFDRDEANR